MADVVPYPVVITVGIEDDRPLTVLRFQAVGIELGLLLAYAWVLAWLGVLRSLPQPRRRGK